MFKMHRLSTTYKFYCCIFIFSLLILTGCSGKSDIIEMQPEDIQSSEEMAQREELKVEELKLEEALQIEEMITDEVQEKMRKSTITEVDLSNYFDKVNGAAVIYDPTKNDYQIYNQELALTEHSPCSTFKIISSLIALENGIIDPDDSTRTWSGEIFWNEEWNKDINFSDAFHVSCVWYFREVINEIGKDTIQEELNKLEYGNCDISDWEGRLNTNNSNPALTGFWIESSLLISPKEQVEVMERIFGDNTVYSKETLEQLKQVMLLPDQNKTDISICGKTGMGMLHDIVVDSWYTGFADNADKRIYFCVYLGETEGEEVSSAKAREIALKIIDDYL